MVGGIDYCTQYSVRVGGDINVERWTKVYWEESGEVLMNVRLWKVIGEGFRLKCRKSSILCIKYIKKCINS